MSRIELLELSNIPTYPSESMKQTNSLRDVAADGVGAWLSEVHYTWTYYSNMTTAKLQSLQFLRRLKLLACKVEQTDG